MYNPWMWGMYMQNNMMMYLIIAMVIPILAQVYLKSTFSRFKRERASSNMTGFEAARRILDNNGLFDVRIERAKGMLGDHYDPRTKTVRLSDEIHDQPSIAAVAVAAHEVGHALQHAQNYLPLNIRSSMVPVVNIASRFGFIAIIAGIFLEAFVLAEVGIILIASIFVFQLITLPVEFNASKRAMVEMRNMNILYDNNEIRGANKVLTAAALTYVAAMVVALMELLRWVAILNNSRGRRD